ncbi:MAG: CoA-binding protein [Vicinamibacteraceae bacterium]
MAARVVAVVGASSDRLKFGNRAVRAFIRQGYDVKPVNPNEETIEGLTVFPTIAEVPGPIDIVSMYVPPDIGIGLLEAIAARHPGELWINPGAESAALEARARALGLTPIYACSIVALG